MSDVPTDHRWHDPAYITEWAAATELRPHRTEILDAIGATLPRTTRTVVELGPGTGELAAHLLARTAIEHYYLVDFSGPMHDAAAAHLDAFPTRTTHVHADFREPGWTRDLPATVDAAVTLQAVHELRHASRIPALYAQVLTVLAPGGTFVMADFVNATPAERAHRLTRAEHIDCLHGAGFTDVSCVRDIDDLACIVARRPSDQAG